jgi:hypothetical protein
MNKFSFTISACIGNHVAIRYFCFNDIYPSCIQKERHLITLVVFFLILHIVDSDNSLFFRNNDVFILIFGIKYVKHLCNRYSENSRFIFMTHISHVNDCEPIIIDLNTLLVLHPLIFKYRDLYRYSIIQFSYFFIWRSGVLPLSSFPLIIVGIFLNVVVLFVPTSIVLWTLIFEFMFFLV